MQKRDALLHQVSQEQPQSGHLQSKLTISRCGQTRLNSLLEEKAVGREKGFFLQKGQTKPKRPISPPATIPVTGVKAEFTADSAQGERKLTGRTLHDLLLGKSFVGTAGLSKGRRRGVRSFVYWKPRRDRIWPSPGPSLRHIFQGKREEALEL